MKGEKQCSGWASSTSSETTVANASCFCSSRAGEGGLRGCAPLPGHSVGFDQTGGDNLELLVARDRQ